MILLRLPKIPQFTIIFNAVGWVLIWREVLIQGDAFKITDLGAIQNMENI